MGAGALALVFNVETVAFANPICSVQQPWTFHGCAAGWLPYRRPLSVIPRNPIRLTSRPKFRVNSRGGDGEEEETCVEELRIPKSWWMPSRASEEAEWLRVALHKWLDDEYCPEETNVEISKVAAHSYYKSLLEKQGDLGEILLSMAEELESISYRDSFHGAFSSANAAVNLIMWRIEDQA